MKSGLQRKKENIIFKCLTCFISCEVVYFFKKDIPQIHLCLNYGIQFLNGRRLQNSPEAIRVMPKNCDTGIQFEVDIGRKLIKNE